MKVPFLDLKAQYEPIQDEIRQALNDVIDRTAFAGGPFVAQFEQDFAGFCDSSFAIGVGSGTAALWLALLGLGVGPGDEVITVPNTFIATVEAISFTGATPVFIDVDPMTQTMDPEKIQGAITPKTKAIIPVHLYGQPADMDPIVKVAKAHDLYVIEDAAQAHDAEYKGRRVGSLGDAACFSFYPGKNLGAYGEAGAVVTDSEALAEEIRCLRDHGQSKKYYHRAIGWNSRMDGFQGAVLGVKLKRLPEWTRRRRENAALYNELLADFDDIARPYEADYAKHVYHLYAIACGDRERVMAALGEREIAAGIHYPVPVHLQEAYAFLGLGEGSFPVAEKCARETLSLPMYAELTREQIEAVCEGVKSFAVSA